MQIKARIRPLKAHLGEPVHYQWPLAETTLALNDFIGARLQIEHSGKIYCTKCQRSIRKSYGGGHCYPCVMSLASCDICMVRPELCHFAQGTCREPSWGEHYCMSPHIVYFANTSGLKVGITRASNIPSRWLDQGAIQAVPVLRVPDRLSSGLLEVKLAQTIPDKTNWRRMLAKHIPLIELEQIKIAKVEQLKLELDALGVDYEILQSPVTHIHYPISQMPVRVVSLNLDKTPLIQGRLLGIKGQYLITSAGVFNVRTYAGYEIRLDLA